MAEKTFGDRTFRCDPLPAMEAFELHLRLGRVLGPALPHVLTAFKGYAEVSGMQAISDVLCKMDTDEAKTLVKDILETCEVMDNAGYSGVIADVHFGRDLIEFLEVLQWAVECQFSPFGRAVLKSSLWKAMTATDGFSNEPVPTS